MPELPEIDRILHSGALAYGEYCKRFEDLLKAYFKINNLVVTNTFSNAISVIIVALELKEGDEVIMSPMACLSSTLPYVTKGLKIIWADVDNHLGTLNPDSVKSKITEKTKCIVHNHYCGYPGHIDEINMIGREYGLTVIDDGIECFGSEYKGEKVGNCGSDVTIFSLASVRIPNTIEGGILIFKNTELYEKILLLRDNGIDRKLFRDDMDEINPECDIYMGGISATMSDVNGYIGCRQMLVAEQLLERQRMQAKKWEKALMKEPEVLPIADLSAIPNYWIFGLLADKKRESIEHFRKNGYYASGVHINNNIYSIFGKYEYLPGVEDFYKHFIALPCGWWME